MHQRFDSLAWLLVLSVALAIVAPAPARAAEQLERVVLVYRHGVRAPLDGEAAAASLASSVWPSWQTPASQLTPHGREAVRLSGRYLGAWLRQQGVLPKDGCPRAGTVQVHANTDQRTIDSGALLADALAPTCGVVAEHLALGSDDALFRPVEAGVMDFDAKQALASIRHQNGGPDALVRAHHAELDAMQTILGCAQRCDFARMPSTLQASANGRGLVLKGPIDLTSGTGEVLLLQYAEGWPLDQVGWGRASPARLEQVSRLHGLLFDIYARPHYMALRSGGPLAREVVQRLSDPKAPAVSIFVGSDNHIAALSSLIGAGFHLPGFGVDDPPPGGALVLERWRDTVSGQRYVRVEYLAQSLQQLRSLQPLDLGHPPARQLLKPSICKTWQSQAGCSLTRFVGALRQQLVPSGVQP